MDETQPAGEMDMDKGANRMLDTDEIDMLARRDARKDQKRNPPLWFTAIVIAVIVIASATAYKIVLILHSLIPHNSP